MFHQLQTEGHMYTENRFLGRGISIIKLFDSFY